MCELIFIKIEGPNQNDAENKNRKKKKEFNPYYN